MSPVEQFLWAMLYFACAYLVIMILMAVGGLILGGMTRGPNALHLLGRQPEEMLTEGQVLRTQHESSLAQLYACGLMAGLVLFYVSVPFVLAGVLATTAGLLYLIFLARRVPVKLILGIVVVGGAMAWAVVKSVFARPGTGSFGLVK